MLGTGGKQPDRGGRTPNRGGKKSDRTEKDPKKSKQPKDKKDREPKPWQASLDARRSEVGQQNRQRQLGQLQHLPPHEDQNRLAWEENQRQPLGHEWGHAVEPTGGQQVYIAPLNQTSPDDPRLQQTIPSYPVFGTAMAPTFAPTTHYQSPPADYPTTGRGYAPTSQYQSPTADYPTTDRGYASTPQYQSPPADYPITGPGPAPTTQVPGASTGAPTSTRYVPAAPEGAMPRQQQVPGHMDRGDHIAFSNITNEHRRPSSSSSRSSEEHRLDKRRKPN